MFKIDFNIIEKSFEALDSMTDLEIRYNLLLGNVIFHSKDSSIEMLWDWIPLFDFAMCLCEVLTRFHKDEVCEELFEFTETTETIKFSRQGFKIKIVPSFSTNFIVISFNEFDKEVNSFRLKLIAIIKEEIGTRPVNNVLNKYL